MENGERIYAIAVEKYYPEEDRWGTFIEYVKAFSETHAKLLFSINNPKGRIYVPAAAPALGFYVDEKDSNILHST